MNIRVLQSAKKHNLTEDEVKYAAQHIVCDKVKKRKDNLIHLAVGILPNGKTCELIFFIEHFGEVVIFHAMSPAKNQFVKSVQKRKRGKKCM